MLPFNGKYSAIPENTQKALTHYVDLRIPPGTFLYVVFCNNLFGAFELADRENTKAMHLIVDYIYTQIPSSCWGSPEKIRKWIGGGE